MLLADMRRLAHRSRPRKTLRDLQQENKSGNPKN